MTEQDLHDFRAEVRTWIEAEFPASLAGKAGEIAARAGAGTLDGDAHVWQQRLAEKGWGAATWPKEYGGAGLSQPEARVVSSEINRAGAVNPIPLLAGMGVTMVGPTILEYGTDAQKAKHLPPIAKGEVRWCLGLSEPNAGSDLASLATKATDDGDTWKINGQKIWTSGADRSQWCGALVRTDPKLKKHDGISFIMLPMDQPGVRTKPVRLISGESPFCETFFDNAVAEKSDLLGKLNQGWSLIKRLLQHERQSQTGFRNPGQKQSLATLAKNYAGLDEEGTLQDRDLRSRLTNHLMDARAHELTVARVTAEAKGNLQVTAAASILKNSATLVAQTEAELTLEILGSQGLGWQGDGFSAEELASVRGWLWGKAISIYGGSFEVQKNIISKNILGLPETTQKN